MNQFSPGFPTVGVDHLLKFAGRAKHLVLARSGQLPLRNKQFPFADFQTVAVASSLKKDGPGVIWHSFEARHRSVEV